MEQYVSLKNVSFRYEGKGLEALSHFSMGIKKGEWLSIVGHNGSGKSTLGKLINGLLLPTEGEVQVAGYHSTNEAQRWEIRKRVGMVFQNPEHQFVATTVKDDIAFGLENRGIERGEMLRRIDAYSTLIGVRDLLEKEPHRLSGGQKQRVAIAGIVAMEPDVIIFDEATSMLDPEGRREVLETIKLLHRRGIAIVAITHDMEEAVMAERIVVLKQGQAIADGAPSTLFRTPDQLKQAGLELPFALDIQHRLEARGITLDRACLIEEELTEELWKYNSMK